MPIFGFGAASQDFDLLVKKPNVIVSTVLASLAGTSESAKVSSPLIWNQEDDTYYEATEENYYRYVGASSEITLNSGYRSEPDLTVNSYIKVCNLLSDRTINYYITLDPNSFEGSPGVQSDGTTNSTIGKIAGRWEEIVCDFSNSNTLTITNTGDGYRFAQSSTRLQTNGIDQSPNYTYSFSSLSQTNHNLITGSKIRCTTVSNSGLILNRVYYAVKVSNTTFRVATTYENALNGIVVSITAGTNIVFKRQSGWILVEEGDNVYGNGGSTLFEGKGSKYIRNPYNPTTKALTSLPIYSNASSYLTGDRVLHSIAVSGINRMLVWECLDSQTIENAVDPALGVVDADLSGVDGDVMLEIPEFYIRKDHFDGSVWRNIKGEDVEKDYTIISSRASLLGGNVNPFMVGEKQDLHFTWVLHKKQYELLSGLEKKKYMLHPVFMEESDRIEDRTYRMTGEEAGLFMPSGNTYENVATNALKSRHRHYLVAGKSVVYYDVIEKGISRFLNNINLALGKYYVSSVVDETSYQISSTKGGASVTGFTSNSNSYGLKGHWFPVVTKEGQEIVSVEAAATGGAIFTTQQDHQFLVGQKVELVFTGVIENFTSGATYYVTNPNYNNFTFQLASSLFNSVNGPAIPFSSVRNLSNAVALPEVMIEGLNPKLVVNSVTDNALHLDWLPGYTTHYLATGQAIVYEGALEGLVNGSVYYVIVVSNEFSIRLASSYENAMLNVALEVQGAVNGSTIKRAEYQEVQISGSRRNIIVVNKDNPVNSYRVVYKGIFAGNADVRDIQITGISAVDGAPLTFTANGHGLKNTDTVYLSYSERCDLALFGRYHYQNNFYWVIPVDSNSFRLANTKDGVEINYRSRGSSSWAEIESAGGMKVSVYRANSTKVRGPNDGYSLGILGVGASNNITLCATGDTDLGWFSGVYVGRPRTGQQVTFGIIRTEQFSVDFRSQVTNDGNSFMKNGLRFRFRATGNLNNVNTTSVYQVINRNAGTGEIQIALEGTTTVVDITPAAGAIYNGAAVIKPIIFDQVLPGNYFINVGGDNTITLHRTYNDSLSKSNAVTISSQPNYRNSQSDYDNANIGTTFNYDFYGRLSRADDCLCLDNSITAVNNIRSVSEATNKNLNYYKGSGLLVNALQYLALIENRKMDLTVTNARPFTRSNRVVLFYEFNNVYQPYVVYEENAAVLSNYGIPYRNLDLLKPVYVQGTRYNSLVGCVTTKNYTAVTPNTNGIGNKTSMWLVMGYPSKATIGTGMQYTDPGMYSDNNRIFMVYNRNYQTRAASFEERPIVTKGWQYFLTT